MNNIYDIKITKIYNKSHPNFKFNKYIFIKFIYEDNNYYRWIDCNEQYYIIKSLIEDNKDKANIIIAKELISKIITDNIKHNEKVLGQV